MYNIAKSLVKIGTQGCYYKINSRTVNEILMAKPLKKCTVRGKLLENKMEGDGHLHSKPEGNKSMLLKNPFGRIFGGTKNNEDPCKKKDPCKEKEKRIKDPCEKPEKPKPCGNIGNNGNPFPPCDSPQKRKKDCLNKGFDEFGLRNYHATPFFCEKNCGNKKKDDCEHQSSLCEKKEKCSPVRVRLIKKEENKCVRTCRNITKCKIMPRGKIEKMEYAKPGCKPPRLVPPEPCPEILTKDINEEEESQNDCPPPDPLPKAPFPPMTLCPCPPPVKLHPGPCPCYRAPDTPGPLQIFIPTCIQDKFPCMEKYPNVCPMKKLDCNDRCENKKKNK